MPGPDDRPPDDATFIKRLRDTVKTRLVLKGLMTAADATLAVDNGLDAIIVSNHGGRDDDFGRSTIDALPEIIEQRFLENERVRRVDDAQPGDPVRMLERRRPGDGAAPVMSHQGETFQV